MRTAVSRFFIPFLLLLIACSCNRDSGDPGVSAEQVPGIEAFRSEIASILAEREVSTLLHDEVFGLLDESSSLFRVLVIKTSCTLPYTSVFLQLDCAYWGPEDEAELHSRMELQ